MDIIGSKEFGARKKEPRHAAVSGHGIARSFRRTGCCKNIHLVAMGCLGRTMDGPCLYAAGGRDCKMSFEFSLENDYLFVVRCSTRRARCGLPVLLGRFLPKLGPSCTALFLARDPARKRSRSRDRRPASFLERPLPFSTCRAWMLDRLAIAFRRLSHLQPTGIPRDADRPRGCSCRLQRLRTERGQRADEGSDRRDHRPQPGGRCDGLLVHVERAVHLDL